MARKEGTLVLGSNLEIKAAAPADARLVVEKKADLLTYEYPYSGMIVSVTNDSTDNGAYQLVGSDASLAESWSKIGSGDAGHMELTQAQYDALTPEEKNNGTVYFITDGGAYVPAVDLIPYVNQAPIVVGKLDLRGDGEFRDIKRVRLWISDLKNASEVITAGWVETGVYVRPIRVYGWFTFHDYENTATGFNTIIQQFPIPYYGYQPIEAPSGEKIGLKFYVDHNNKLRMVVDRKSYFNQDDFACVIIDFMETPVA